MSKTDKELAVELVSAYLSGWFSRPSQTPIKPLDGNMLATLIHDAYFALKNLDEQTEEL